MEILNETTKETLLKYLLGAAILSYVLLTMAAVAISDVNRLHEINANQKNTIEYLTTRLLAAEQIQTEIEDDRRMLRELRQVGKQIEQ